LKFYNAHLGDKYDYVCLPKAIVPFCIPCINPNKFFCSELIVKLLQEIDIIDKHVDAESISPAELFSFGLYDDPIVIKLN